MRRGRAGSPHRSCAHVRVAARECQVCSIVLDQVITSAENQAQRPRSSCEGRRSDTVNRESMSKHSARVHTPLCGRGQEERARACTCESRTANRAPAHRPKSQPPRSGSDSCTCEHQRASSEPASARPPPRLPSASSSRLPTLHL
eukprot:3128793-Pleurochrysis_carterae.AAC.7